MVELGNGRPLFTTTGWMWIILIAVGSISALVANEQRIESNTVELAVKAEDRLMKRLKDHREFFVGEMTKMEKRQYSLADLVVNLAKVKVMNMTGSEIDAPGQGAFVIDTFDVDLPRVTRGVWVGTGGDLEVVMRNGDQVVFKNATSGVIVPLQVKQVVAAGTTASDLIGIY